MKLANLQAMNEHTVINHVARPDSYNNLSVVFDDASRGALPDLVRDRPYTGYARLVPFNALKGGRNLLAHPVIYQSSAYNQLTGWQLYQHITGAPRDAVFLLKRFPRSGMIDKIYMWFDGLPVFGRFVIDNWGTQGSFAEIKLKDTIFEGSHLESPGIRSLTEGLSFRFDRRGGYQNGGGCLSLLHTLMQRQGGDSLRPFHEDYSDPTLLRLALGASEMAGDSPDLHSYYPLVAELRERIRDENRLLLATCVLRNRGFMPSSGDVATETRSPAWMGSSLPQVGSREVDAIKMRGRLQSIIPFLDEDGWIILERRVMRTIQHGNILDDPNLVGDLERMLDPASRTYGLRNPWVARRERFNVLFNRVMNYPHTSDAWRIYLSELSEKWEFIPVEVRKVILSVLRTYSIPGNLIANNLNRLKVDIAEKTEPWRNLRRGSSSILMTFLLSLGVSLFLGSAFASEKNESEISAEPSTNFLEEAESFAKSFVLGEALSRLGPLGVAASFFV